MRVPVDPCVIRSVPARPAEAVVDFDVVQPRAGAKGGHDGDRLVYSVAEAAELLGISRAFAYELVARGELPVIRLGRRRLVPKVALIALVEKEWLEGSASIAL
jgi:excisionase family DNA binding protein